MNSNGIDVPVQYKPVLKGCRHAILSWIKMDSIVGSFFAGPEPTHTKAGEQK